ncbi:MAG: hypothetical protein AB7F86_09835 [Bdellovibrionales bacterium]
MGWLLFGLVFVVHAPAITGEFLRWDDRQNILLNPWLQNMSWESIWTRPYYGLFIPVPYTVWAWLYHFKSEPWPFHLVNVVLHAGNAWLVYRLGQKVLRRSVWVWWAALAFGCHPLMVESVAWISAGRDLLAAHFTLWGLCFLVEKDSHPFRPWMSLGFFSLALLSKPTVLLVPIGVLGFWWRNCTKQQRQILFAWAGASVAAAVGTLYIQGPLQEVRVDPPLLAARFWVALDALAFYFQKVIAPWPLAADYGRTPEFVLNQASLLMALFTLAVAFILTLKTWRYFAFSILLLLPVLGLIPFQAQVDSTVADRYFYLAWIPLAASLFSQLGDRSKWLAPLLVGWAALSFNRSLDWRTNAGFFSDLVEKNPQSYLAQNALGTLALAENDRTRAEDHLLKARKIRPMDAVAAANLAQLRWSSGQTADLLAEFHPLLKDPVFLEKNKFEDRGLSALYRLVARGLWARHRWEEANDYYCSYFKIDPEDSEGQAEILRFLKEKAEAGLKINRCDSV